MFWIEVFMNFNIFIINKVTSIKIYSTQTNFGWKNVSQSQNFLQHLRQTHQRFQGDKRRTRPQPVSDPEQSVPGVELQRQPSLFAQTNLQTRTEHEALGQRQKAAEEIDHRRQHRLEAVGSYYSSKMDSMIRNEMVSMLPNM